MMNDFDFEELDKAVNSLAPKTHQENDGSGAVPVSTPAASRSMPTSKPVDKPPAAPPPRQDSQTAPAVSSEPSKISVSRPDKVRGARLVKRGSFMDIVPPSPRKTNTRVGPTLQPVSRSEDIMPEPQSEPFTEGTKKPETPPIAPSDTFPVATEEPRPPAPKKSETPGDVSWPDPLDFHDVDNIAKEVPKKADDRPTASPFLAEAKVEKRPLGAFSTFAQSAGQPESPEPKPAGQPPEPKPDPGAIDELTPVEDGLFKEPEAFAAKKKFESTAESEPEEETIEPDREPAAPDIHSKAMMSIPEQYRTERKIVDKTTRSVFDTKEYHPPLLEAAIPEHHRGSSVWAKLFVAFVVLALLGVSGYFVYIFIFAQS